MKTETAAIVAVTAAGGFTVLGGAVWGIPKAAIVGAGIGTLFVIAALPTGIGWRRWAAVLGSFSAGALAAPVLEPTLGGWAGPKVSVEPVLVASGAVMAACAQAALGWAASRLFGGGNDRT